MKQLALLLTLGLALAGCSTLNTLQVAIGTSVTPTQAILAANAFDAAKSGATAYLTYCHSVANAGTPCSAPNRRAVIKYINAGTASRNQIEGYITTSTSVPSALYNALVTTVSNLKATPAANYIGG